MDGSERTVWVYDPKELAALPTVYRNAVRPPGETAARVFELLDEGKTTRDIVIEMREMPQLIEELRVTWQDSGGAERVITPAAWHRLEELVGPFKTVTDLVERVEEMVRTRAPGVASPTVAPA